MASEGHSLLHELEGIPEAVAAECCIGVIKIRDGDSSRGGMRYAVRFVAAAQIVEDAPESQMEPLVRVGDFRRRALDAAPVAPPSRPALHANLARSLGSQHRS